MEFEGFLERFNKFRDSVIRGVHIRFRNPAEVSSISVEISTRDRESSETGEWRNVVLIVEDVSEFSFQESSKASYQVISDGLNILQSDDLIYIDFGHFSDPPDRAVEIRNSPARIIGKHLSWRVEPYREII